MLANRHPLIVQRDTRAWQKIVSRGLLVVSLLLAGLPPAAQAQSEASAALSMLPIASVVGTASVATAGAAALGSAPLLAAGTLLTVRAVEASARGTVLLLESASDGGRLSVEVVGRSVGASAAGVGAAVAVSVIGTGVILSAAGEVLAFIPNELGRALLHNERVTP